MERCMNCRDSRDHGQSVSVKLAGVWCVLDMVML